MSTTIWTGLGAVELVAVTIPADVDISGDEVQLSVGTYSASSSWVTPDLLTFSTDGKTATASLLIGNGHINPIAGPLYYMWWRVVDGEQIKIQPVRGTAFTVTDTEGFVLDQVPPWVPNAVNVVPDAGSACTLKLGTNIVTFTQDCTLAFPAQAAGQTITLLAEIVNTGVDVSYNLTYLGGSGVAWLNDNHSLDAVSGPGADQGPLYARFITRADFVSDGTSWLGRWDSLAATVTLPDDAPDVTVTDAGGGELDVSWPDLTYIASYYIVERAPASTGPWTVVYDDPNGGPPLTDVGTVTYPDTGLTIGVTQWYRVHVINPAGSGPLSTPESGTPS